MRHDKIMEKNNDIHVLDFVKHCGTDEFAI